VINVDAKSLVPLYEQIVREFLRLIATGVLKAGDPVPSIRDLAGDLLINPNTVARAYRELEQQGWIVTQKARGSVVAERSKPDIEKVLAAYLDGLMDEVIAEARKFDLDRAAIRELFEERLRKSRETGTAAATGAAGAIRRGGRHE